MKKNLLFFLEILYSFVAFMLTAFICIQIYSKAVEYKRNSIEMDDSVRFCSSVAEICLSGNGDSLTEEYHGIKENGTTKIFVDSSFTPCGKTDSAYTAQITEGNGKIDISIYKNETDRLIYNLSVS